MTLDWPAEFPRTPMAERTPNRSFEVSLNDAISDLAKEMERLGVDDWRLSTNMDHQSQNPNFPYANQPDPDDAGVVLRWSMEGEQYAVACDSYTRVRDNIREIGLYVREKRKMEKRPVTTGYSEFTTARLPPGDPDREKVVARQPPHDVLNVAEDADPEVVKAAARRLAAKHHPDSGEDPDPDKFKRVNKAKREMLDRA